MINIIEASGTYLNNWDKFISSSINGTIFNKHLFLSYHGDRFKNGEKHLIFLKNNTLLGQISINISEENDKKICKSPYGGSYGGIILQKQLNYSEGKEIIDELIGYLSLNNIDECYLTPPINCCCKVSLDTFYFNMLEAGFKIINQDISSVVEFGGKPIEECIISKTRNRINHAIKNKVEIIEDSDNLIDFWLVLENNFKKFEKHPTHTYEEFETLRKLLSSEIKIDIAYLDNRPIAGIAHFVINNLVNSLFYIAQDLEYQHYEALSYLILNRLKKSQSEGFKYFDFGTSTANMVARENLFRYKEQFSKSGYFRYTFKWNKDVK